MSKSAACTLAPGARGMTKKPKAIKIVRLVDRFVMAVRLAPRLGERHGRVLNRVEDATEKMD